MLVSRSQNTNQAEVTVGKNHSQTLRNSDRIQIRFGSYGLDIIDNDEQIRVSKLYSTHDGLKINRTFAVVAYPDIIESAFKKEHEAIINGQSIGVVFEHNGWEIEKHHQYLGEIELPTDNPGTHSLFGTGADRPAIHIYSLVVNKNNSSFNYAQIAEVHHPEFLQLKDLQAIYGHEPDRHLADTRNVQDFLEIVKTKIQSV